MTSIAALSPLASRQAFQAPAKQSAPRFGRLHPAINITDDFKDGTATLEMERRIEDVRQFVLSNKDNLVQRGWLPPYTAWGLSPKHKPSVHVIDDIPHIDYEALSLHRLGGARTNDDVFIHVTDPGVGVKAVHDRSILVTPSHGTYIGPNNGSLGLVEQTLRATGEPYKVLNIDFNKVEAFERLRTGNPNYKITQSFHGRDVFAVVGAAIAMGVEPEAFQDDRLVGRVPVYNTPYSAGVAMLPVNFGEQRQFYGFRDKTMGNVKTDLMLTVPQRDALSAANAQFRLYWQDQNNGWKQLDVPFKGFFSQVPKDAPLAFSGSSHGIYPNSYFLEFARNLNSFSDWLNLPPGETKPMIIQRIG